MPDSKRVYTVWKEKNNIEKGSAPPDISNLVDQLANFFVPGPFYYYVFNFHTLKMDFVHPNVRDVLGIEPEEFTIEKFMELNHPDDLKQLGIKENAASDFLFSFLEPNEIPHYKVIYLMRLRRKDGTYATILHQAKSLKLTADGKIEYVLGVHTDISFLPIQFDNRINFVGDKGYKTYNNINPQENEFLIDDHTDNLLTSQEIKIIEMIAQGLSSAEIAENLYIAESTVKSHRKNIFKKVDVKNSAHLIANCIRNGII